MSAERVTLGNSSYDAVGSTSAPLLLRSNGIIKLQWGGSMIDLLKDGGIAEIAQLKAQILELQKQVSELQSKLVTTDNK